MRFFQEYSEAAEIKETAQKNMDQFSAGQITTLFLAT